MGDLKILCNDLRCCSIKTGDPNCENCSRRNEAERCGALNIEAADAIDELRSLVEQLSSDNKWNDARTELPKEFKSVICWAKWKHNGEEFRGFATGFLINRDRKTWGGELIKAEETDVLFWAYLNKLPMFDEEKEGAK